ncbi:cytochrome P450 4C1 isoform X2 [Monomorium pharaonis]|uniref:cytochrome P450 4C1 isoform X2 n=1 Tax=Monomorium pharaonis TaxID=307658 RepID=UPI0017472193|nr:cytochrome P450 4C1 isoform X2 [Monomorium pharaonis]
MLIIILLLLIPVVYLACHYYVHNGRLFHKIPGPSSYPIIGHLLLALCSREKLWEFLITFSVQYYPIFKVWIFLYGIVSIRHPDDLETILSSTRDIDKSRIYEMLHPWLGMGLLTSGETAMGTSLQGMGAFQQQYRKAVHRMGEICVYRFFRPWLYADWIFSLSPTGREQKQILKVLHGFTEKIIAERKDYHRSTNGQYLRNFDEETMVDDEKTTNTIRKKRLAMLDLLILASQKNLLTDLDIREEVDTFTFEGHDTVSMGLCFTLCLLAEHKDIQNCVRKEVDTIMKENQGNLTMQSLQDLQYLERCIKEALRMYPSVFFVSRVNSEDVQLNSYIIPARTIIHLNILEVHRDPNFWPNPEIFDPDRFLPENIRNRHPYSYIPFSAGPRNCIGQRFALLEMKAMIASLIHNFYVEPVDYLKDLRTGIDFVYRPLTPHRLKFIPVAKECI